MIRIGILGFAHGHINAIGTQWKEHPEYGVELTCGWDHNADRGAQGCEKFGLTQCPTVEELLGSVDAVIITSETSLHAELVEQAAAAKKNIILYKPMALTMEQADRIVNAVEENGVRFTMAWRMRTDPQNQKMRQMILDRQGLPVSPPPLSGHPCLGGFREHLACFSRVQPGYLCR